MRFRKKENVSDRIYIEHNTLKVGGEIVRIYN